MAATTIEQSQLPTNDETSNSEPSTPQSSSYADIIVQIVSSYGWCILLTALGFFIIWKKKFEHQFLKWQERRNQDAESARLHRDPDAFEAAQAALERSRVRLQAQMDDTAKRHKELLKQKEEAKRLAKLAEWNRSETGRTTGYSSTIQDESENRKNKTPKEAKSGSLRGDYNPLMGAPSSSTCYRPSRRGAAGGGG